MGRIARCVALTGLVVGTLWGTVAPVGATTPETGLPLANAPLGIGAVAWPSAKADVSALLSRLPPVVAGEQRGDRRGTDQQGDRYSAVYGDDAMGLGPPLAIQVVDVSTGDFWPADWTAERVVLALASGADWMVEAAGRDGDLVWIRWQTTVAMEGDRSKTPAASRSLYTLSWGQIGMPWLFSAAGDTPARLDALVAAFVTVAAAEAGIPGATPTEKSG